MFGSIGGAVLRRAMRTVFFAAAGLVLVATANGTASAETRTIKFYHVHLREKSEITYKRNGRYLADGLKKINWALRDWRESKPTKMDPALIDLMWEAYRQSGSRDYIHVIGGYRSPGTNKKLRSRSSGVAEKSLHVQGKAIDFFIPDVPLRKMRDIGLKMQIGGVGYYPRSGSPFVHFDTGRGRHWPRLSRKELAGVFPSGNTIHVPSDGKPLPGYQAALASYNQRRAGQEIQVANASDSRSGGGRSLIAALFGGGREEEEDNADAAAAPTPARRAPEPARRAPEPAVQVAAVQPSPRPAAPVAASAPERPASLPTGVAMPDRVRYDTSGRTPTPPSGVGAPPAAVPAETEVAALDLARVPMPTAAPARPSGAAAPVVEEAVESSLMAAAVEREAPMVTPSAELAYAVPMPSHRPPFEEILTAASAKVPSQAAELPAAERPSAEAVAASAIAAALPVPADRLEGAAPDDVVKAIELAALQAPAPALAPASTERSEPAEVVATESPSGKSGRVVKAAPTKQPQPSTTSVAQETIASRIEVASLVTSPTRMSSEQRATRPSSDMLVVSVPVSGVSSAFAPRQPVASSDRFSGSASSLQPSR